MQSELLFADIEVEPEEAEVEPEEEELDLETGELHMKAVHAKSGKEASRVQVTAVSAVVNELTDPATVLYAEVVGGESEVEAVLAGTNPEPSMIVTFMLAMPGKRVKKVMFPPECRRVNARLKVPGWGRVIQHAAVAATGAEFVVVKSESELWPRIRDNVRTPLLSHWGDYLMERVLEEQVVSPCQAFGIPQGLNPYMLHPNATDLMDKIVSEFVNENVWDLIVNR